MGRLYRHWLFSLAMLGLLLMLAACGGGSASPTTGSNGSASPITSSGNTTPTPTLATGMSTISFTASGGLTGMYVITTPIESGSNQLATANKKLTISGQGNGVRVNLTILPYTGPGSYTLSNKYFPDGSQSQTFDIQKGVKVWGGYVRLSPTWTCPLTIASDTAVTINAGGSSLSAREIKGSFSCSIVLSALNTDPPVNISNGQFDVFVPLQ